MVESRSEIKQLDSRACLLQGLSLQKGRAVSLQRLLCPSLMVQGECRSPLKGRQTLPGWSGLRRGGEAWPETPQWVLWGGPWLWLTSSRCSTYPELTTIAIIQLQNVAFSRHRGQRWLFPGQRGAVVVGTTLLQLQDGGCWDWRGS